MILWRSFPCFQSLSSGPQLSPHGQFILVKSHHVTYPKNIWSRRRKVWGLRTRRRWIEGALNGRRNRRRLLKNWRNFSEATKLSDTSLFTANWKHAYYCFLRLGQCLGHSPMVLLANWTNTYSIYDLRDFQLLHGWFSSFSKKYAHEHNQIKRAVFDWLRNNQCKATRHFVS